MLIVLACVINQFALFPTTFWLPHVFGVPPKHQLAVLNIFLFQCGWNAIVMDQGWRRAEGKEAYDWLRWDWVLHALLGLELLIVYEYNDPNGRYPIQFAPGFQYLPVACFVFSAVGTSLLIENLRYYGQLTSGAAATVDDVPRSIVSIPNPVTACVTDTRLDPMWMSKSKSLSPRHGRRRSARLRKRRAEEAGGGGTAGAPPFAPGDGEQKGDGHRKED
jgi:hypothetical protein